MKFHSIIASILFLALPAHAETAPIRLTVEGRNVVIAPPDGDCLYDPANAADAKHLGFLAKAEEKGSRMAMAFVDCASQEAIRAGEKTDAAEYGQVLLYTQGTLKNMSRRELADKITQQYKPPPAYKEKANPAKFRFLRSDPDFVQMGTTLTAKVEDKTQTYAGVITFTKLGIPAYINLYRRIDVPDKELMTDLSAHAATYARKLIALNPDIAAPPTGGQPVSSLQILVFVAIAGLTYFLHLQRKQRES